jgi:hypothetical protein
MITKNLKEIFNRASTKNEIFVWEVLRYNETATIKNTKLKKVNTNDKKNMEIV